MNSLILTTVVRFVVPLLMVFSIFVLLRGHNEPGGGFIGGLIASLAVSLLAMSCGPEDARRAIRVDPRTILAFGLLASIVSGIISMLAGDLFMEAQWYFTLPGVGKLGTVLLFDMGVYGVVLGAVSSVVFETIEAKGQS